MTDTRCKHCGNLFHWHNAFSKFGYNDGDGDVQTPLIAQALEHAGYSVKYSRWSPHNTIIYSIQKAGIEYMPDKKDWCVGYDDPTLYLPKEIQAILNEHFPAENPSWKVAEQFNEPN